MPASIFQPAYDYVDARLTAVLNDGLSNVISQVEGPLRLALMLYIVLWAYSVIAGRITEPVMDGVLRIVKLCFIYTVATTVAYNDYVTEPLFNDLPDWLAEAISGSGSPGVGPAFDSFFNRGGYLATKIWNSATLTDPGPYLTGGLVWLMTAVCSALGFGIVMLAKVALAVLVALGPIFIACLVFDASRQFFFGWLKQGVNYLVLFALIITIFQIILTLVEDQWGNIDGQADPNAAGLLFIALCLLGGIFFLQTPNIAAGIAGGAAAGIGDFANGARAGFAGTVTAGTVSAKLGWRGARALASRFGTAGGGSVRPTSGASRNGHPRR